MDYASWTGTALYVADLLIRVGFSIRILRRRLSVGTSLAWLTVILVFGESRLGRRRALRAQRIHATWQPVSHAGTVSLADADTSHRRPLCHLARRLARRSDRAKITPIITYAE
jgi:hypothetical protein